MASAWQTFARLLGGLWPRAALTLVVLLLAGCATGGYGGGGGGGGGYPGGNYPGQYGGEQLYGTVEHVDPYQNRILLVQDDGRYGSGYGSRVELFYDRNTRLFYQGRQLAVEGLERGDGIRVDAVRGNDGRWWARTIEVVRNVRDSGYGGYGDRYGDPYGRDPYSRDSYNRDPYGGNGYAADVRGTVLQVDPQARLILLDGQDGGRSAVRYDDRTVVEFQGRAYRPENLERGDVVRIQARSSGNGQVAERVWVERDSSRR